MGVISLKVNIAGKEFPVSVKAEESAMVQLAAEKIATVYTKYKTQFVSLDRADLLSMVALELATEKLKGADTPAILPEDNTKVKQGLFELNTVLADYLGERS